MNIIPKAATLIIALTLSGCSSINKTMESWMGHHQSDLVASWGPPQQVITDGQGGSIFVYTANRAFTSPGSSTTTVVGSASGYGNRVYGSATSITTYTPPQTTSWSAYRMFWINASGRIYRWSWKGL